MQPGDVVHEPVGLAGGGQGRVVLQRPVVRAQRTVGLHPERPLLLEVGRALVGVERRLGDDQPAAQSAARAALVLVLLAVTVVDDVLGQQQLAGHGQALQVERARMLEHHGAAELEAREVPVPGHREEVQAPGPLLQPAVDLRGPLRVGGLHLPVAQTGDRPAAPGPDAAGEVRRAGQRTPGARGRAHRELPAVTRPSGRPGRSPGPRRRPAPGRPSSSRRSRGSG